MRYYEPKNSSMGPIEFDKQKLLLNCNDFEQRGLEALRRWHMRRNYDEKPTPTIRQIVVAIDYQFSDYHLWVSYDLVSLEVIAVNMCRFCTEIEASLFFKETLGKCINVPFLVTSDHNHFQWALCKFRMYEVSQITEPQISRI